MRSLALGLGVLGFTAAAAAPAAADLIKIALVIHGSTANESGSRSPKASETPAARSRPTVR